MYSEIRQKSGFDRTKLSLTKYNLAIIWQINLFTEYHMPQFELKLTQPTPFEGLVRARTKQDALLEKWPQDAGELPVIQATATLQGWQEITLGQVVIGQIRDHNRMRFRRD